MTIEDPQPGGISVRCRGVVHLYRTFAGHDVVALQGIDLDIEAGQRVAFLGPSGSGKSTLLTLFGGIQRPSAGTIHLGDDDISRMTERQLARIRGRSVGTMLQGASRNLLPYATGGRTSPSPAGVRSPRAPGLMTASCSSGWAWSSSATSPSPHVRRPAPAARARLRRRPAPRLLSPTSRPVSSDHEDRDAILELIHRFGDELGTTILVVTHQPEVAETFPRTVTMKSGRIGPRVATAPNTS